ncbi:Terpenoid synthase 25 [Cardamine amara subsp. amara]|uniref:Terpenoid synthase 25 n=1 Tax=Cardamine amara subsp. amara TaxID=228776 RepID=A0ABD1BH29_CARAN
MQTSRMMSFGNKTLAQAHKVPLCRNINLSFFPRRLLQNKNLSRKPTKQDSFYVTATSGDLERTRPLAQFTPTFLGDHVVSVPVDDSEFHEIEHEIESVMKPYVKDMLMSSHICDKEKIRLIHLLISLAISHYFEDEIEKSLNHAFGKLEGLIADEDLLCLRFSDYMVTKCLVMCLKDSKVKLRESSRKV